MKYFIVAVILSFGAFEASAFSSVESLSPNKFTIAFKDKTDVYLINCSARNSSGRYAVSLKISEDSGRNVSVIGTVEGVVYSEVIRNAMSKEGFWLFCQHGDERSDVGDNMLYYVGPLDGKIVLRSFKEILAGCDFTFGQSKCDDVMGVYYIGEDDTAMTIVAKVSHKDGHYHFYTILLNSIGDIPSVVSRDVSACPEAHGR